MVEVAGRPQDPQAYRHILVLLFAGYLLSFADRIVFGLVLKPIKATLALSDSQAGLLAGAAFAVAYALFSPAGGYFIDRYPRRPIFAFAVAFWSAATFSCGLAGSFLAMAVSRAAVGAGEALLHPLSVSLIGDTVVPESRAKAFAVYFSAGAFGTVAVLLFGGALFQWLSGLSAITLPLVGAVQPWQVLFISLCIPGFLLALVLLAVMKDPPKHGALHGADGDADSVWAFLRANRRLAVAFFLGYPLIQMAGYALLTWVFIFFDRVHGWPAGKSGVVFALTSGLPYIAGCLLSGQMIGWLRQRGYADASLRACSIGGILFSVAGAAAVLVPSPYAALALLPIGFFFAFVPTIGGYSAVSEVVPPHIRARVAGLNTLTIGLITTSLGPFLVGFFTDHLFPGPIGIRWALLTTLAISAIGGALAIAVGLEPFRRRLAAGVESRQFEERVDTGGLLVADARA